MSYVGDIRLGDTLDVKFCTVNGSGAPTTLAGTPVISAYVNNSTTEITAGITLTVDFDTKTGLHNVRVIATSGNGYAAGNNYQLVITTGTVNAVSVVGYVVAQLSIRARPVTVALSNTDVIDAAALKADAGTEIANAILDLSAGVETTMTLRQAMRLILAASAGKVSGAASTTVTIRNVGDTKNRVVATVDANGNRTAITTDVT